MYIIMVAASPVPSSRVSVKRCICVVQAIPMFVDFSSLVSCVRGYENIIGEVIISWPEGTIANKCDWSLKCYYRVDSLSLKIKVTGKLLRKSVICLL